MRQVRILATCRNPELLPYTLLVFKTLRVGFPTATILVDGNYLDGEALECVRLEADAAQCYFENKPKTTHHQWVTDILFGGTHHDGRFWFCDTDVILYRNVEDFVFKTGLAGYRIPEFVDEFSKAITRPRLHTSLLAVNSIALANELFAYRQTCVDSPFTPLASATYPVVIPLNGRNYFYDTAAVLYHAIGGTSFTDEQKDAYHHFHFGTFSDMVLPTMHHGDVMAKSRQSILDNPELGRGQWRLQDAYFESRRYNAEGKDVIVKIAPEDAEEAKKFCVELCCGNQAAMTFCGTWYDYCHWIDDLVDTIQDGRPVMSKEQILSIFFKAAILYNHSFFLENRGLLFPIILETTNMYQVSVAWEKSPLLHRRTIADVFRCCGNRMFSLIALICGGEKHMLEMTKRINERDYLLQHDAAGNPI